MALVRRIVAFTVWLVIVLGAAEAAVRGAGWVLRRDRAIGPSRPGATVIYCVGDSFTFGQGVEPSEAWPHVLADELHDAGEADLTVQTLAKPGSSSSVAMLAIAKALKTGDARFVLVMTGWNANDGDFAAWAERHARAVPWTARADLWLSHSRLYRLVKQAATYRSRALVLDDVEIVPQTTAMQLYDFRAYQEVARDNLRRIAGMCHAAGVPCAFLTYPHRDLPPNRFTQTEYYHAFFGRTPLVEDDYLVHDRRPGEIALDAVIRTVAESSDVLLIDTQPAFASGVSDELFQKDWHHPTALGQRLIAETVFTALRDRGVVAAPSPSPAR